MPKEANKKSFGNLPGAGPGRPKGSLNKTTALLKDAILKAAEQAGGDGEGGGLVGYLTKQAAENPGPFLTLLGKVLPMQLTGEDGGPIKIDQVAWNVVDPSPPDSEGVPPAT